MPTYEYKCSKGHHFELFQRISEDPVDTCPECGAPAERQLSSGAGLIFKGSGFYITDYRSDSYKKAAESDSGGKPGGTTESAPAAKPESASSPPKSDTKSSGGSSAAD